MTVGLVGRKCGMSRVFTDDGASIPVTVIEVLPNRITQIKTNNNDGYSAIQITTGKRTANRVNKPAGGHFVKAGVEAGNGLWEFLINNKEESQFTVGSEITAAIFSEGQYVDVSGVSKGKGFAGVIKKYHFTMGDATHGNSLSHRSPGSIGQRQTPGRVFKGKKMCGHMGSNACTVQSQKIVRVDVEKNLILVAGAVPGAPGGYVKILPAEKIKKSEK